MNKIIKNWLINKMAINPSKDFLFQDKGMYKIVLGFDEEDLPEDFNINNFKEK